MEKIDWNDVENRKKLGDVVIGVLWIAGLGIAFGYFFGYSIAASVMLAVLFTYLLAIKRRQNKEEIRIAKVNSKNDR